MKILVLGSEGFIGSHVTDYFSSKGDQVLRADIVLKEEPGYYVINPEQADFGALFRHHQFDVCINATGAANVQFSFSNPAVDFALNTANVFYMLDALRQYNPQCRFINFSSAAIYGNPPSLPISENDAPLQPLSPYGWHKLYSEQLCHEFATYFGVPAISLRVFSAFGPGLKKQLFWDVYQKICTSTGHSIQMFGTGNESRDFIYIADIAAAVDAIIKKAQFNGDAVNIACGREITIRHAVTALAALVKPGLEVQFTGEQKKGDPINWRADISRLQSMDFTPQYSFEEGIKQTAEWLKKSI